MQSEQDVLVNDDPDVRLDALKNDPVLQAIKRKAAVVPVAAMGTSLLAMLVGRRLLQARPNVSLKRPVLFQVGMGLLGAMTGLQLSALWLQREYMAMDPEGRCLRELRAILELKKATTQSHPE